LGFEVTGFDFSPTLTAAARQHIEQAGCKARMLDAPASAIPELTGVYDALLIGRGFYHHMPGKPNRVAFLAACGRLLKPGAPIILADFHTRPSDLKGHLRTWAIAKFVRRLSNNNEPVELGDALGCDFHHCFTRQEITDEFAAAGLKLEEFIVTPFGGDSHLAHVLGRSLELTGANSHARPSKSHALDGAH
jgi:SAM-dependent methyltransferase